MEEGNKIVHESFGILEISRFTGNNSQFFGSDLLHNGGISITISNGNKERSLNTERFGIEKELIRIELSNNQFVDAITSGMNASGVPCTITRYNGKRVERINHVEDKKAQFNNDMKHTQAEYGERIDDILKMFDGNVGKRKTNEIKHELNVLKNHISSNTNFVMDCFNEAMDKTVTEAKHSISNYIDHKVHTLGIQSIKKELQLSIGNNKEEE